MVEASTGDLGTESRKRQVARWAMEDFLEEVTFKPVRASQKRNQHSSTAEVVLRMISRRGGGNRRVQLGREHQSDLQESAGQGDKGSGYHPEGKRCNSIGSF